MQHMRGHSTLRVHLLRHQELLAIHGAEREGHLFELVVQNSAEVVELK